MKSQPESTHPSYHPQSQHIKSLLKRDGKINVRGNRNRRAILHDLYHYFFSLTWPRFFVHIVGIYLTVNLIFSIFYFLLGVHPTDVHAHGLELFKENFFFSVETMTAIEYSRILSSIWFTYVLMTLQAILGILTLATITGLFYARFSRPTSKLIFSNRAIIGPHNGLPCFHFRVANERLNQIVEARITLTLTKNEITQEGEHVRKFYNLILERDYSPLFALSWTVRHYVDEKSPLFGLNERAMQAAQIGILASLTGIDDTFAQPIMARHTYIAEDIVYNKQFKDIIIWHDQNVHIDLKGIHDVHELKLSRDVGTRKGD